MGIALITFSDMFADWWTPLQSIANRWLPDRRGLHRRNGSGLCYVAVRPACTARSGVSGAAGHAVATARPLRVIRVVDPHELGRRTGRVMISGRMADVCAELDRLAALEAQMLEASHRTH